MSNRLPGLLMALLVTLPAAESVAELRFCSRSDVRLRTNGPHSLVMADFYAGDGPDLAITFGTSGKLSLWRNDGTGNFTETDVILRPSPDATNASHVADPGAIIAADFNSNGTIDIAGTNRTVARYFAYRNPGVAGSWGAPASPDARRGDGNAMTTANFNGDRALDIVVCQDAGALGIALGAVDGSGNPTGSWGIIQRFTTTATVGVFTDVEVANFVDRPAETGTLDVLAVDNQFGQLVVWPGDWERPGFVLTDPTMLVLVPVRDASGGQLFPVDAILGNWNGDAWPDVLVSTMQGVVLYFQGNGTSTVFDAPVRQDFVASLGRGARMPTEWSSSIYVDVTGDGIRDLVVADAGEDTTDRGFNWVTILPGLTDSPAAPSFDANAQDHYAMGDMSALRPGSVAVGDVDGDLDADIVVLHGDEASLTVLRNDGTGLFDAPFSFSAGGRIPRGLDAGRLDADADDDVVTVLASPTDPAIRTAVMLPGMGGDALGTPVLLPVPVPTQVQPSAVRIASINTSEDATNDVLASFSADQVLWENNGAGAFAAGTVTSAPGVFELGELHGGIAPDLATAERSPTNRVKTYEGSGTGTFTQRQSFSSIWGIRDIAIGQFFGGAVGDLVVSGTDVGGLIEGLYLFRWSDARTSHDAPEFVPLASIGLDFATLAFLEVAQLDAGPPELLAVSSSGEIYILRASGTTFALDGTNPVLSFGSAATGVVVRDLTGDGILDIAVADRNSVRVREGQGGSSFGPDLRLASNIDNAGLAAADVDGDGIAELVALSSRTADLTVFCNQSVGSLLLRVGTPETRDTVHWSDQGPGVTYVLASGSINDLWANRDLRDATCIATVAATTHVDARALPAPAPPTDRAGYYYVLKCSGGDCTEPDFGETSLGTPRFGPGSPGAVPDPCP